MQSDNLDVLVSVCVITYNHEKYISQCLDSILSQETSFKFNVFVSDDCSNDQTLAIIEGYEKRFPNVHAFSRCGMEKSIVNGKPTGNMNFVENLKRATGKYIAICDGDDFWSSSDKLQIQFNILQNRTDVAIVCSSKNNLHGDRLTLGRSLIPDLVFSSKWLSFYNPIPSSSVLFRKNLFQDPPRWFFDKSEAGDWPLWFQVSRNYKIFKISRPLLNYRVHQGNFWMNKSKSERSLSALNVVRNLWHEYHSVLLLISLFAHTCRYRFHLVRERLLKKV